jgi:hypothetical protein
MEPITELGANLVCGRLIWLRCVSWLWRIAMENLEP